MQVSKTEILAWLREMDPVRLERLWQQADEVRRQKVGDEVHLRGLVEISNHCVRSCQYCGLHVANRDIERYRMTKEEILDRARLAVELGYGTIVLQSGEDPGITQDSIEDIIRQIKALAPLAVTLSLGERTPDELAAWRTAGADRYLLKFETSNRELFERIHPPRHGETPIDRIALLGVLRELGYEIGTGVMIGIPGQTYEDLARSIELFRELDVDMIGVGPYVPHPGTPLAKEDANCRLPQGASDRQVANDDLTTYKVVALTRLVCPWANIPSTTALAITSGEQSRYLALCRGANVVMPRLTPEQYDPLYDIYPGRKKVVQSPEAFATRLREQLHSIGRMVGRGRGDSRRSNISS